nr:hypothetical protein [Tanacetum cinerariifolium]
MSTSNQQTLADSRANEKPSMLEKRNYIPWESRFRRFLDNKLEEGERIWNSIQNGPYVRPMIPGPDGAVNINIIIIQRVPRNESTREKENVQCYNCNEKGHYARDCQKPRVHDAKYFREKMFLAIKDEAESNLNNEENDFMLDSSYGE